MYDLYYTARGIKVTYIQTKLEKSLNGTIELYWAMGSSNLGK